MQNQTLKEYESNLNDLTVIHLDELVSDISDTKWDSKQRHTVTKDPLYDLTIHVFDSVYQDTIKHYTSDKVTELDMKSMAEDIEQRQQESIEESYDHDVVCGGDKNQYYGVSLRD